MLNIEVKISENNGPYVVVLDFELADELDDYLGEKEYVLYNIVNIHSSSKTVDGMEFWFGKAASEENIKNILKRFEQSRKEKS